MRKIFTSILAFALVLTSFSMVAFAAPETDVYFGTEGLTSVTATDDTYTVDVYLAGDIDTFYFEDMTDYYISSIDIPINVADGTVTSSLATIDGLSGTKSDTKIAFATDDIGAATGGNAVKLTTLTVTKGTGATTTVSFGTCAIGDVWGDGYNVSSSTLTITWPSEEEEEDDPVAVIDTEAGGVSANNTVYGKTVNGGTVTYNNVWIGRYKVTPGSKTITGATLTFAYDADGNSENGNEAEKTLDTAALNISGDGTYQFAIAVVGVPSGAEAAVPALSFN